MFRPAKTIYEQSDTDYRCSSNCASLYAITVSFLCLRFVLMWYLWLFSSSHSASTLPNSLSSSIPPLLSSSSLHLSLPVAFLHQTPHPPPPLSTVTCSLLNPCKPPVPFLHHPFSQRHPQHVCWRRGDACTARGSDFSRLLSRKTVTFTDMMGKKIEGNKLARLMITNSYERGFKNKYLSLPRRLET